VREREEKERSGFEKRKAGRPFSQIQVTSIRTDKKVERVSGITRSSSKKDLPESGLSSERKLR